MKRKINATAFYIEDTILLFEQSIVFIKKYSFMQPGFCTILSAFAAGDHKPVL